MYGFAIPISSPDFDPRYTPLFVEEIAGRNPGYIESIAQMILWIQQNREDKLMGLRKGSDDLCPLRLPTQTVHNRRGCQ